jgi:hypothetical protein
MRRRRAVIPEALTLADQLEQLLTAAALPNITIQVMPTWRAELTASSLSPSAERIGSAY